tara:strand:- start:225 stop:371 length:147 start_codon:yes stop_codon:yes gene_type:complete
MRIIFKLLFGLGKKEDFHINFYTILFTAVCLGAAFTGIVALLIQLFVV